jgi:nitrous oxidase accessory protein NosD
VKKSLIALAMAAFISLSATAQAVVAEAGKMLQASDGARIGAIYRVSEDGSAQVIINGKMVTVPASTLSVVDGKLTTSLSKSEVRKLK